MEYEFNSDDTHSPEMECGWNLDQFVETISRIKNGRIRISLSIMESGQVCKEQTLK